ALVDGAAPELDEQEQQHAEVEELKRQLLRVDALVLLAGLAVLGALGGVRGLGGAIFLGEGDPAAEQERQGGGLDQSLHDVTCRPSTFSVISRPRVAARSCSLARSAATAASTLARASARARWAAACAS